MHHQRLFPILCLTLSLMLSSCTTDEPTGPVEGSNIILSAKAEARFQKPSEEKLNLSSVKVLLKSIRLHTSTSHEADIQEGPVALSLNLTGTKTCVALGNIPEGFYDRIRFRLHKPEDADPIPDPEFRSGTSGDQRFSVIVTGTWNGMPFTFRSLHNADQEYELRPTVRVSSGAIIEVTLLVDPRRWFQGPDGPLDPTRAENADLIDERIAQSFCRIGESAGS